MTVKLFGPPDLAIACVFGGFFTGTKRNLLANKFELHYQVYVLVCVCLLCLLTALSLVDYSVSTYAFHQGLPELSVLYLGWKSNAPVVGKIMLGLILMLPFEIFRAVKEDIWFLAKTACTGNREGHHAERIRMHAVGTMQFFCLCGILTFLFASLLPVEQRIVASKPESLSNSDDFSRIVNYHLILLGLNVIMLILPLFRYSYSEALRPKVEQDTKKTKIQ